VPAGWSLSGGALSTERLRTEGPLGFAGIPPVEVETVLLEIQAAELLHDHIGECENSLKPGNVDGVRDLGLIAARSGLDAVIPREVLDQISPDTTRSHLRPCRIRSRRTPSEIDRATALGFFGGLGVGCLIMVIESAT